MVAQRYNAKVKPKSFTKGDLVWRKTKNPTKGKVGSKPYRIDEAFVNDTYRLECDDKKKNLFIYLLLLFSTIYL